MEFKNEKSNFYIKKFNHPIFLIKKNKVEFFFPILC